VLLVAVCIWLLVFSLPTLCKEGPFANMTEMRTDDEDIDEIHALRMRVLGEARS
jgi:hypothetical protein